MYFMDFEDAFTEDLSVKHMLHSLGRARISRRNKGTKIGQQKDYNMSSMRLSVVIPDINHLGLIPLLQRRDRSRLILGRKRFRSWRDRKQENSWRRRQL